MEIQLFDGDRFLFRVNRTEPLWDVVAPADGDAARMRAGLEEALRRLRPGALAGGYAEDDLDVLGERVRVDVRNPANRELIRASGLEMALRDTEGPLQAFVVPDLEPRVRRLATLVKESGDGVPAADLQRLLRERLNELVRSTSSDAVRQDLRREADEIADPRVIWRGVSYLEDAGLVENGELLRPTEALRLILL
jgi:hypothetical protein